VPNVLASRLTREHAQDLLSLERQEVVKMRGLYEEARIELLGRLSALGASSNADTFTAQQMRGTLAQVQSGIGAMTAKLSGAHGPAIVESAKDGALQTLDEIAFWERAKGFRGGAFGRIQTAALRSVMAHEGLLLSRFEASINAYGGQMIGEIQRRLGLHILQRSTWQQMSTDVAGRLYAHGVKGAQWKAERIVRSELIHGLNAGHQASISYVQQEHLPDLSKQWDAQLDERTCPICQSLNGKIVAVDGTWTHGSIKVPHPPVHPNCRCRLLPYRKQWADLVDGEPEEESSPVKVEVDHSAAKARVVMQPGAVVPKASLGELKAAKDAYQATLLATPGDTAALESAALVLRRKLVGFHKKKSSGQALSMAVVEEFEQTVSAAQVRLAKARAGAAKELDFYKKSLASAYEKAGGSFPDSHLSVLELRAKTAARLDGKTGEALEAAVTEAVEDAKTAAVAKYEARVAASAKKVSEANEALVDAVIDGHDVSELEAALTKAAESQGRLLALKGDEFKAHVAKVVSTAKDKAADALTVQVVETRILYLQAIVEKGIDGADAEGLAFAKKAKQYHLLKNDLHGDDLVVAVAKDVASAQDHAQAQIKAAAVAAEAEAAKVPLAQVYDADKSLALKGAIELTKLKHFDDVALKLGLDAPVLRGMIRKVLDDGTTDLTREHALQSLKVLAGKGSSTDQAAILARLKEVADARWKDEKAVAEVLEKAKVEAQDLAGKWFKAQAEVSTHERAMLTKWVEASAGMADESFIPVHEAYQAAIQKLKDLEGPAPFTTGKLVTEFSDEAKAWVEAAKEIWDPAQVKWAIGRIEKATNLSNPTAQDLLAARMLFLGPEGLKGVHDLDALITTSVKMMQAKDLRPPDIAVFAKLKEKFKPAAPNLKPAPVAATVAKETAGEIVDETPWPATQSGAPKQVVLPDGSFAKQVASSSGSNPGGFYQAVTGETYFVKFPKSVGQVGAEKVSADLASMMGLAKKDYLAFKAGDTHVGIASPKIAFKELGGAKLKGWSDQDELARHFVHAAWTRNWDVVGLGYDNLVEKGGKLLGVDYGGSLLWRAQGTLKGDGMPAAVAELKSLRLASANQQTASAFGHLTDQQVASAIKASLSQLDDDAIKQVVATGKFTATDRAVIEKGLLARKEWLDDWADGILGKQTPEDVTKALLGKLPNDPDAALVFKSGAGGGAGPESIRTSYTSAIGGDTAAQAKIGRRLWGGTPQLEANQDVAARFLIAAWKKAPDTVRTELTNGDWAAAMKPVLDVLESQGSKLAAPEQLFQKLKAVEAAAKKAAAEAAELAKKKAAEAAAKAALSKAERGKILAAYQLEKEAYAAQLSAWNSKIEKFLGDESKRYTKSGDITKSYEKKLSSVEAKVVKKGGEGAEKAVAARSELQEQVTKTDGWRKQAEQRRTAAAERPNTYFARSQERDAKKLIKAANRVERQAKAEWARTIEKLLPEGGFVPSRPVPPKAPPGIGGASRPERFNVNENPTANPDVGHPTWQTRRAELQQIAREIGMSPAETQAEIETIEKAIGEWKGSARSIRKAQQLRFAGKTDEEILAAGVRADSLRHAKAMDGPLWGRAAGHDGDLWRGERWAEDAGRTKDQNRAWLKQFLSENVGGEWTWPYSAGWATNNGFLSKGYGGGMEIQYHLRGKSSARSIKNIHGMGDERELQTRSGSTFRIESYEWFETKNHRGHEVHINLVEIFEDGTTGLD